MTRSTSSPSTGPLPVAPGELDLHLLLEGSHRDPHGILGPHRRPDSPGTVVVRTLRPGADEVDVVIEQGPTAGRYPLAPVGTAGVFAGMLVVYKTGAIRVTPKFTRWLLGALIGVVALSLVNLIASLFTPGGLGLRDSSNPVLAIGFSLLCIGVAAFTFLLDFDMIDKGIRQGAPERFAWYAAFGLTVALVWLYLEILRLLSYFRD